MGERKIEADIGTLFVCHYLPTGDDHAKVGMGSTAQHAQGGGKNRGKDAGHDDLLTME